MGRGSVAQAVTDGKTTSMTYSPFGEMLTGKQTGFGFNAEWYDAATGMQNLRARQYEPAKRYGGKIHHKKRSPSDMWGSGWAKNTEPKFHI